MDNEQRLKKLDDRVKVLESLIVDALVRVKTMETILSNKNAFTVEEYTNQLKQITGDLAKIILEKANVPGNLDQIVKDLQDPAKKN